MDAMTSVDSNAAATYNNGDADADPNPNVANSDPAPYTGFGKDGKTPIHWENTTRQALQACLAQGWRNFGMKSCAVSLNLSHNSPRHKNELWAKALMRQDRSISSAAKKRPGLHFLIRLLRKTL